MYQDYDLQFTFAIPYFRIGTGIATAGHIWRQLLVDTYIVRLSQRPFKRILPDRYWFQITSNWSLLNQDPGCAYIAFALHKLPMVPMISA